MKKVLSTFLSGFMALSLVACGSSSTNQAGQTAVEKEEKTEEKVVEQQNRTLEQNLDLMDNEFVKITLKDIRIMKAQGLGNMEMNFSLENTGDKDISCRFGNCQVGEYLLNDGYLSTKELKSGKKGTVMTNDYSYSEYCDILGVDDLTSLKFSITVFDSNGDYGNNELASGTYTIYPFGKEKDKKMEVVSNKSDKVLVNNDLFKLTMLNTDGIEVEDLGLDENLGLGDGRFMKVAYLLENKTETSWYIENVYVDDISINSGEFFLYAGSAPTSYVDYKPIIGKMIAPATIYLKNLEEGGINQFSDIEKLEFDIVSYDSNYNQNSETVTVNFKE